MMAVLGVCMVLTRLAGACAGRNFSLGSGVRRNRTRPGEALALLAIPLVAHHSFQAEFDASKGVTLTGVVTKLEWTNPHAHFYIDVKGADGKAINWNLELASPNVLRRLGWNRDIFKVGDTVT